MDTQNIQINWQDTNQVIEGFGCFGGREKDFFQDSSRDDLMKELFSQLQLTILRTEVKPSFSTAPGERNFNMHANLNIPPNDPYFNSPDQAEVQRRSQLWVLKTAYKTHKVRKLFASTWSPPYYMKTKTLKRLKPSCYYDFANFLADYVDAYQQINIPFYAISPQNEPFNIFSPWDVCFWSPAKTATFVEKYMRPIFDARELKKVKIIVAECSNWTINTAWLLMMPKKNITKNIDIVASHGYTLPNPFEHLEASYDTNPLGLIPSKFKQSVWITEVASTKPFDPSMRMGLQAAICIHKFLAVKNANAYVFWLGIIRGDSNEALICSNGRGNYQLTKAFDVFGNYSRYIKEGYTRVTTNSAALNKDIYVSSFKQTNPIQLTTVIINASEKNVPINLRINNEESIRTLIPYLTPAELGMRWQEKDTIHRVSDQFAYTLSPKSVTTLVSTN